MMEKKITVKDILKNNYSKFKDKYWYKVPKDMRKHIFFVIYVNKDMQKNGGKLRKRYIEL